MAGRVFPSGVQFGDMTASAYPAVQIGNTVYHAGPGLRIFDQSNRMILPQALPQTGAVIYKLDMQNDLIQLWLLTPDEEAAARQAVGQ